MVGTAVKTVAVRWASARAVLSAEAASAAQARAERDEVDEGAVGRC